MKRYCAILIVLSILFACGTTAFADDSASSAASGDWLCTVADGEVTVTGYRGASKNITIPSKLNGLPVTAVGRAAFYRSAVETVSFPSSVREIGWWAFYGARSLKSVGFSDGLQRVDFGAFMNCPALKEAELPTTVFEIGSDAFGVSCATVTGVQDYPEERRVSRQSYSTDRFFVIRGWSGTAAESYARRQALTFSYTDTLRFGDVNDDGMIDAADLTMTESRDLTEKQRRSADLNADGFCDEADTALLLEYLSGRTAYCDLPAASFDKPVQNRLYGKKMYCDGDSIAKGTGTDTFGSDFASYCHYIGDRYGMDYVDKAVGGTTLARVKENPITDRECILDRVLKLRGSYDVILLDGGFNDMFLHVKAGKVTADSDRGGKYDETTTLGALEKICYFLNKNYKDAVKLFVLCHEYDIDSQPDLWAGMKRALDKWDIPYVDIIEETDFTAVNKEINNQYFFFDDEKGTADELHPLAYPHISVYGKCVEKKLSELMAQREPLTLSDESLSLAKGESAYVSVSESVSWTSSDESVVSVQDGFVTANSTGTAYVRAETTDGRIAAVRVDVQRNPLCVYLNRSAAALDPFEGTRLVPSFLKGTVSHTVTYTSSDESVAAVFADGTVLARSRGSATITCKLSNGVKTTCEVIVQ